MNNMAIVGADLDNAKRHLSNVDEAIGTYWSRSTSDMDGQMNDIRRSVKALSSAIASVAQAVERLAELPVNA
jgi:predicted sugar kinase